MKIGFFDSGIGGTTILRRVMQDMPQYDYLYYADNAHLPYGEKSPEELFNLTINSLKEMFACDCKLVVLACNTATTVLPRIQQEWLPHHYPDQKVLGIIRPTAEHMIASGKKKIYILATEATVKANSYGHELKKLGSDIELVQIACPDLATAIEEEADRESSPRIRKLLTKCLSLVTDTNPTLYTACTHYELVRDMIYQISGIKAFTQGYLGAESLKNYLKKRSAHHDVLNTKILRVMMTLENPSYEERLYNMLHF